MKRKIFIERITVFSITLLIVLGLCGCVKGAEENQIELKAGTYNEKYLKWLELPEELKEKSIAPATFVKEIDYKNSRLRMLGASIKYDPREELNLKVKKQGNTEICWAMSATTALEAYMKKVENKQVEYSPMHIEYATSKTFLDGINKNGYNREINSGGNAILAYGYMTSGKGPVLEKNMPFTVEMNKINLSQIEGKTVEANLKEYVIFSNIYKEKSENGIIYTNGQTDENRRVYTNAEITQFRNQVKEHILKYGAVTAQVNSTGTQFYSNPESYLKSKCYYCDESDALIDHQVTIIGWDDNYAVTNFNEEHRPSKPGAYIVQNSYGTEETLPSGEKTEVFDNGYLYISYEDFIIETAMTGIKKLSEVDYDQIYQYDPLGCNQQIVSNVDKIAGANVFSKQANKDEVLDKISFYTAPGCTYEIYVNSKNGELNQLEKVQTVGQINDCYYKTLELEKPILLTGSKFVVAIRYISENNDAYLPIECVYGYDTSDVFYTASSNPEESYLCAGDSLEVWTDMEDIPMLNIAEKNLCLKAFTTDIYSDNYNVDNNKITKIEPNTTFSAFKENILTDSSIEAYDKEGNKLTQTDLVTTDTVVKLPKSSKEYKLIVTADINADGKLTPIDLLKLKRYLVDLINLTESSVEAADVNYNGKTTTTDLLLIKKMLVK